MRFTPSKLLPMDGWAAEQWNDGAGKDELKTMIEAAHRHGLEFHAWKVNFNAAAGMRAGAGPAAMFAQMKADDRLMRDINGVQAAALNPGDPRNRQLEVDAMLELVEKYDVDGVHFDYIRYTEVGGDGLENFDFDYGDVSRREFEKARGSKVQNWPADVFAGALKSEYEDWERENINDVVKRVYDATKARKPNVMVSAAVWRANRKYRAGIKQDWTKWAREGWLDFVVPMDYTADAARFARDLDEQIPNVAGHIPIAAGIGTYLQPSPADVVKQIEIARAKGADGYVLFAYNDDKIEEILPLLKAANATPAIASYRAPRVEWGLRGGMVRRDAPMAYPVKKLVVLSVEIPVTRGWKKIEGSIATEGASGTHEVSRVVTVPGREGFVSIGTFAVPAGVSRLVLRGEATDSAGKTWPILVRGPLIEGLDVGEMRALPPQFAPDKRAVAIYADGQASEGLLQNLKNAPGIDAQMIYSLEPKMWKQSRVLIVPHLEDVQDLTPDTMRDLRAFVRDGGRLILTHDAVGYRWHQRLFPEIGVGVERLDGKEVSVGANSFGVTAGAVTQGYGDHVVIQPAPGASVLARETASDKAVVVAGYYGLGIVVMNGTLLGYPSEGEMPESEKRLLWELVGASS